MFIQSSLDSGTKWRDFRPKTTVEYLDYMDKMIEPLPFGECATLGRALVNQQGRSSSMRCIAVLEQRILRIWILYSMSLLVSCILLAIHWLLIQLIKTVWRVPKFPQQVDKKFILIVGTQHLWLIMSIWPLHSPYDQSWFFINFFKMHLL